MTEAAAARAPNVDVLRCSGCAAPAALGDGEVETCRYCSSAVPVPEEHVALRRVRRGEEELRRNAEELLGELDTPPSYFVRVLAAMFDQSLAVIWFWWAVPLSLTAIFGAMKLMNELAVSLGRRSVDDMPMWLFVATIGLVLLLLVFVPRALGIYANRRATARAELCQALAARPPSLEGGPSECRECGAPLHVPDEATVVRCLYCACDNAVRLRSRFVRKSREALRAARRSVAECVALDGSQRAELRRKLVRELAKYVLGIGGFFGLWSIAEVSRERAEARGEEPGLYIGLLIVCSLLLIGGAIAGIAASDADKRDREARLDHDDVLSTIRVVAAIGMPFLYFGSLRFLSWLTR